MQCAAEFVECIVEEMVAGDVERPEPRDVGRASFRRGAHSFPVSDLEPES